MSSNTATDEFPLADVSTFVHDSLMPISYPPDSVIFEEGESSDNAYIIDQGNVQISVNDNGAERVIATLGPGELLGEMAPLDTNNRSATATALVETTVIPISASLLKSSVANANPLIQMLLQTLVSRLRNTQGNNLTNGSLLSTKATESSSLKKRNEAVRQRAVEAIRMEKSLREAIQFRQFELFLQPIVDLNDHHIAGFESLIRWFSPQYGMVSPVDFIEAAEDSGLILPIGKWVLEETLYLLERLQTRMRRRAASLPPLFGTANVSARQLSEANGADELVATINKTGVDPRFLKVEITEGLLMEDPEAALIGLNKLKAIGVQVAIDDFGTGYSSLSYLHRFPLDTMKIDGSFIRTMLNDAGSMAIVKSITNLSSDLNMDVVAEGVEHEAEVTALKSFGCEYGQGYFFSPPVNASEALEMLNTPYLGLQVA